MNETTYDRTTQDVGNILALEHVNVTVPDQTAALLFYVSGLGFTRDPYMMVGPENMWINVGQQQFRGGHLPVGESLPLLCAWPAIWRYDPGYPLYRIPG